MKKTTRENIFKWTKFIAFVLLIVGGLNFLLMGLFGIDVIGGIFGGANAVVSRICYSLFGMGALVLLTVVLVKVFAKQKEQQESPAKIESK